MSDKKWLWHRMLGHANWRLISKLVKTSFKSKDIVSTSRPLELLHIDLFGPVSTASYMGVNMEWL